MRKVQLKFHPPSSLLAVMCTNTTAAMPSPTVCVHHIVEMSLRAVDFLRFLCREPHTSKKILSLRDYFQMIWIHASSVPAKMINLEAGWDGPFVQFISKTVGGMFAPTAPAYMNPAVAKMQVTLPKPTGRGFEDFALKTAYGIIEVGQRIAMLSPTVIMKFAPSPCQMGQATAGNGALCKSGSFARHVVIIPTFPRFVQCAR